MVGTATSENGFEVIGSGGGVTYRLGRLDTSAVVQSATRNILIYAEDQQYIDR